MGLIDAYRMWRLRRWMRGHCYICGRECDTRVVAYKSGDSGFHIDHHVCADHRQTILGYVRTRMTEDA